MGYMRLVFYASMGYMRSKFYLILSRSYKLLKTYLFRILDGICFGAGFTVAAWALKALLKIEIF